jgi:hypothetical protein
MICPFCKHESPDGTKVCPNCTTVFDKLVEFNNRFKPAGEAAAAPKCPNCGAPKLADAVECPKCGVIYAKARSTRPAPPPPQGGMGWVSPKEPPIKWQAPKPAEVAAWWKKALDAVVSKIAALKNKSS